MTEKEGEADRKVPLQPLVFVGNDGKTVSRYNLRKVRLTVTIKGFLSIDFNKLHCRYVQFGELPYHLVRARRLDDLFQNVLFHYQWYFNMGLNNLAIYLCHVYACFN